MRGITARRFLRVKTCVQREKHVKIRVKTCVQHEKHVKTVSRCMPEAPGGPPEAPKLCEASRSVVFYVSKRVCSKKNT